MARQVERRKHPDSPESRKMRTDAGLITIHGIRAQFDVWIRRVGGLEGIMKMKPDFRQEIIGEILPIARLCRDLVRH